MLSLQLAKCSGIFYKLRSYVTENVLRMMYHSLVYSRLFANFIELKIQQGLRRLQIK